MSEPTIFTTPADFIRTIVHPALGEHADDYDVDAIADQVLEYYSPPRGVDPAWRDDNRTGFIQRQDVDFWEVVRRNENTPAPAATGDEGNELANGSVTTAYLSRRGANTGHTYGTFSGVNLPMDDYITIVVPLEAVRRMNREGAVLVGINTDCVAEQAREIRQRRAQVKAKRLREARSRIRSRVSGEHDAELTALEKKIETLQQQINAKVDALLAKEEVDQ